MTPAGEKPQRASVPEIVGAWLHVWTPPRDVRVPPVPWRALALAAAATAIVVGAALAVAIPHIDAGKRQRAAQSAARLRATREQLRAQAIHAQRPRTGRDAALRASVGGPAATAAERAALVRAVEASIMSDARARAATGEFRHVSGPTSCTPALGTRTNAAVGAFDCFAVADAIKRTTLNVGGGIGYPFVAIVDFRDYRYRWCKVQQIPGERSIPDPRRVVHLPAVCQVPDSIKLSSSS